MTYLPRAGTADRDRCPVQSAQAAALKTALAERAETFCAWLFPAGRREGVNLLVGSLAGERGESLSICVSGPKPGIWKDFAGDAGGNNLLELLRAARGGSFADACREARAWLGLPPDDTPRQTQPSHKPVAAIALPYRLNEEEVMQGTRMAERLIANPDACESIARRRGWRPATILGLAQEAYLGVSESDRLVFLYDTGAKERWQESGERRIRFLFGKPDALWRGGLLPAFGKVFVTEGETDAVSLVDAGIEEDSDTLVVALPSAGTWKPWWEVSLAGKEVTLCLDADHAGQAATEKIIAALAPYVASLRTLNLKAALK